jgi:membrane peptidoglycan carboxypeptidase
MRGGKDFYTDQWSTCWQMTRQAGSSFKTYALVTAIKDGYSPNLSVSTASPTVIKMDGYAPWTVNNYSGGDMGTMTLARATALSSNTAYARVMRAVGPDAIAETANSMGVASDLHDRGPNGEDLGVPQSVVLGAKGVNTLDMASGYSTLANNGKHNKPTAIMKIVDRQGNVVYEHQPENEQILTPEVAYATTDVLRGVVQYGTGKLANISGRDIAGKTGTSDKWKDAWFIGYTPQLCTAIWVGYRDEASFVNHNEGGVYAAPVWHQFMTNTLASMPVEKFQTVSAPKYDSSLSFMTPEERSAAEAAAKQKAEQDAKKKEDQANTNNQNNTDNSQSTGSSSSSGSGSSSGSSSSGSSSGGNSSSGSSSGSSGSTGGNSSSGSKSTGGGSAGP